MSYEFCREDRRVFRRGVGRDDAGDADFFFRGDRRVLRSAPVRG